MGAGRRSNFAGIVPIDYYFIQIIGPGKASWWCNKNRKDKSQNKSICLEGENGFFFSCSASDCSHNIWDPFEAGEATPGRRCCPQSRFAVAVECARGGLDLPSSCSGVSSREGVLDSTHPTHPPFSGSWQPVSSSFFLVPPKGRKITSAVFRRKCGVDYWQRRRFLPTPLSWSRLEQNAYWWSFRPPISLLRCSAFPFMWSHHNMQWGASVFCCGALFTAWAHEVINLA